MFYKNTETFGNMVKFFKISDEYYKNWNEFKKNTKAFERSQHIGFNF